MRTARGVLVPLLLSLTACTTRGPPTVQIAPLEAAPPGGAPLGVVAFLTGCWRGTAAAGGTVIEERWSPAAGDFMQATTRFLRGGRVVDFEFGTLGVADGTVVLTPYPRGERSPHPFRLTRRGPGRAVFEAPEHDYPKRIVYEHMGDGALLIRIDAGEPDPEPRSWRLEAVPCP